MPRWVAIPIGAPLRSLSWCWSPLPGGSGSCSVCRAWGKIRCLRHFEGCEEKSVLAGATVLKNVSSWLSAASGLVLLVVSETSLLVRGHSCFVPTRPSSFCGLEALAGQHSRVLACPLVHRICPCSGLSCSGCHQLEGTWSRAGWVCAYEHRRPPGGRQGEVAHRKWRFISARATNGACLGRKAGSLLQLEVLARCGVCMWGRSWVP